MARYRRHRWKVMSKDLLNAVLVSRKPLLPAGMTFYELHGDLVFPIYSVGKKPTGEYMAYLCRFQPWKKDPNKRMAYYGFKLDPSVSASLSKVHTAVDAAVRRFERWLEENT